MSYIEQKKSSANNCPLAFYTNFYCTTLFKPFSSAVAKSPFLNAYTDCPCHT